VLRYDSSRSSARQRELSEGTDVPLEKRLCLGIDHKEYGEYELGSLRGGRCAYAISVGGDPLSPARLHKPRHDIPNEDALLVAESEVASLIAVADAHFGHEASHELLGRLSLVLTQIPSHAIELLEVLSECHVDAATDESRSETTLLIACANRKTGAGFGISVGDSSLFHADGKIPPTRINRRDARFLSPRNPASLDPRLASEFAFQLEEDSMLLATTDGIDACCYNSPERSIGPMELGRLRAETDRADTFLEKAVRLALEGVAPHPGGQDNIAAITLRL